MTRLPSWQERWATDALPMNWDAWKVCQPGIWKLCMVTWLIMRLPLERLLNCSKPEKPTNYLPSQKCFVAKRRGKNYPKTNQFYSPRKKKYLPPQSAGRSNAVRIKPNIRCSSQLCILICAMPAIRWQSDIIRAELLSAPKR